MARKKNKSRKNKSFFSFGSARKGRKPKTDYKPALLAIMKVAVLVCVIAAVLVSFIYLKKYVKKSVIISQKIGTLELIAAPNWVNEQLKQKIYEAATGYGEDLRLDDDAAISIQQNIELNITWLDQVEVRTTHRSIRVSAKWRKPLALVKQGLHKFYIDADLIVLDFVPMPNLPIVEIQGLSMTKKPTPGSVLEYDDLTAAIALLKKFNQWDQAQTPAGGLLYEIDRIDISNFNGRRDSRISHIILYTTDNTQILWGAEIGTWQRHLEAPDEEKLTNLYAYYKQYGSLLGDVKYINLRFSQDKVYQPVDKY